MTVADEVADQLHQFWSGSLRQMYEVSVVAMNRGSFVRWEWQIKFATYAFQKVFARVTITDQNVPQRRVRYPRARGQLNFSQSRGGDGIPKSFCGVVTERPITARLRCRKGHFLSISGSGNSLGQDQQIADPDLSGQPLFDSACFRVHYQHPVFPRASDSG